MLMKTLIDISHTEFYFIKLLFFIIMGDYLYKLIFHEITRNSILTQGNVIRRFLGCVAKSNVILRFFGNEGNE